MESLDDAYKIVVDRLRANGTKTIKDPQCCSELSCNCKKFIKVPIIDDFCIDPLRIYLESQNDILRITTKKALMKQKTEKKALPLDYLFLTINPKPAIKFPDFRKKLFKLFESTLFQSYCAVIEQRGTEEQLNIGQGFHAHILFKRHTPLNEGLPPTNISRNLKNSWKNYCSTNNPSCFNLQYISSDFALDKLDYILGNKTGDGKDIKQLGDLIFRKQNNLESSYGNLKKSTM